MVSEATAQAWLDEIVEDERLKGWIAEAKSAYDFGCGISNGDGWYSQVADGKARIGMGETSRHLPSFAHEVLHVCLSARGYKHIVAVGNAVEAKTDILKLLVDALDNELQHHKMFDEFTAAGFNDREFYMDSDDASHVCLRQEIKDLNKDTPPVLAVFPYLPLIAPGGAWPDGEREDLIRLMQEHVSMDTWDRLQAISGIIDRWKEQKDLDPTNTVADIIDALGGFDGTYVGEPNAYPIGAFIPRSLTQVAFEAQNA